MPRINAPHVKPTARIYKYGKLSDAMDDITKEYVIELAKPIDLFKKYLPLVAQPFKLASMRHNLMRRGAPRARRFAKENFKRTKKYVKDTLHRRKQTLLSEAIKERMRTPEVIEQVTHTAIQKAVEGAEKHARRVEAILDKAHGVIADIEPTPADVGGYLCVADQFDKIGRRLYKMDDQAPISNHQFNVAVLTNLDALSPAHQADVIEVSAPPPPD